MVGDFVELPVSYDHDIYQLEFSHDDLPRSLEKSGKALRISGNNASDDLFMFIKRELGKNEGIEPGATYLVTIEVELATNTPAGSAGIGGSPGESVYVKVGASSVQPVRTVVDLAGEPYYRLNVDKGDQGEDGENGVTVGNVAKLHSDDFISYEIKTLDNRSSPLELTAASDGSLWVFVGTDSGFEGITTLYYARIELTLEER